MEMRRKLKMKNRYFMIEGIEGVDKKKGKIGYENWEKYEVDESLKNRIDIREEKEGWKKGLLGIGEEKKGEKKKW